MDAVRGLAALLVMLGHSRDLFFLPLTEAPQLAAVPVNGTGLQVLPPHITIGNEMVVVFFVLSGYLVGGSVLHKLAEHRWSWQDYLLKRLTRLWVVLIPALVFGLAVDILGLHLFGGPHSIYSGPEAQHIVSSTVAKAISPGVFFGNIFFVQGIYTRLAGTNDSLWSLAYEFWYYIWFPALLLPFASWLPRGQRAIAIMVLLVTAVLLGPALAVLFPIWIAGALLAKLRWKLPQRASILTASMLSLGFPVAGVVLRRLPLSLWKAEYLIAAYFVVLLWVLLQQDWPAPRGAYRTVAGALSRLSYTLYAVHLPVIVFLTAVVNRDWHRLPRSPANVLLYLAVNMVTMAIAYLFYLAFEKNTERVRKGIRSLLSLRNDASRKLEVASQIAG